MAPQGYFTDDSMLRRVVGDRVTGLSGQRALLVMAAHPVAFAGFFAHTGALDDPYARLERTATVMNAIAFGTRAQADRMTGLSGPRALLMMATHPVAFEGFFAHTGALDDPYARLQRTAASSPRRRSSTGSGSPLTIDSKKPLRSW